MKELLKLCDAFDAGALPPERMRELVALARKAAVKRACEIAEHRIPEDFELNDKMREFAEKHGFDADELFGAFKDWHLNKGTLGVDWEAGFRTWVRNQLRFNPAPTPKPAPKPRQTSLIDLANRPDLMPNLRRG